MCADVTAQTLRGAGYDLVALLDADVRANSAAYGIDEPDAAINFRRVRNQKVFFDRHTALHTWLWPDAFRNRLHEIAGKSADNVEIGKN